MWHLKTAAHPGCRPKSCLQQDPWEAKQVVSISVAAVSEVTSTAAVFVELVLE